MFTLQDLLHTFEGNMDDIRIIDWWTGAHYYEYADGNTICLGGDFWGTKEQLMAQRVVLTELVDGRLLIHVKEV